MIVDTHTYIWHGLEALGPQIQAAVTRRAGGNPDLLDASERAHAQAMEPVTAAFVLGFRSARLGAVIPDEIILAYMASQPGKLIGFAGVDPMAPACLERLDEVAGKGFAGIVISPSEQGFHPCHTRAMALYEKCQARSLPVIVHSCGPFLAADSALEYAQPWQLDEVARTFRSLKILLAHAGEPFVDQALALVQKNPNVYTEISGLVDRPMDLYNVLLRANRMEVMDRLLLGTGFPFSTPQRAIEAVYSINRFAQGTQFPAVPREKLRLIVEHDPLEALGLKRPTVAPADLRTTQTVAAPAGSGAWKP